MNDTTEAAETVTISSVATRHSCACTANGGTCNCGDNCTCGS